MGMCLCCGVGYVGNAFIKRYDAILDRSIGLGITLTVRHHARRLCDLQREEHSIETELQQLLNDSKFTAYREVFKTFGFGLRLEAIILSQIYPLQAYGACWW
jgi:hypothetical protein